jgi:group I intron endonuclease
MKTYKEYSNKAGIYKLTCTDNGKLYVGKSINIERRLKQHKASKGKCYLQNAIVKHGWDSFTIEILEVFEDFNKLKDNNTLLEIESYYISLFDSTDANKGYNRCEYSNDVTGIPLSEEHKEKLRQANLGKSFTQERIENIRQAHIGIPLSDKHKESIRLGHVGTTLSDETKRKIGEAHSGKILSEEHKEKLRQAHIGKILSEETRKKMSLSRKGVPRKPFTEETKEKMRQAKLGKKRS